MTTERALFKVVGTYRGYCKPIVEKQLKDEIAVKSTNIDYITECHNIVQRLDPYSG